MEKVDYVIEGLDCAACASDVECHLKKDPNIRQANVNFAAGTLSVEYKDEALPLPQLEKKVREVEAEASLNINRYASRKYHLTKKARWLFVRVFIAAALLIVARFVAWPAFGWALALYLLAYITVAYDVLFRSLMAIVRRQQFFDENALMSIATIGALAIGQYPEAVLVMLLNQVGEIFEDMAVSRSRQAIIGAIDMRPKNALKKDGETWINVLSESLAVGDVILVRSGETVPVDAEVLGGQANLDLSSLTGEPIPVPAEIGHPVLSGSKVRDGALTLCVKAIYRESTVSRILAMMTQDGEKKAKAEKFIARFAKIYTPIVFGLAMLLAVIPPLWNGAWHVYIYKALTFLVVSCPCAIVISVPLAYFAGLGLASKNGILVKGATHLDDLTRVRSLMFDKTGTITKGTFRVDKVRPAADLPTESFIRTVVAAESLSAHPIAKAIVASFDIVPDTAAITDFAELPGLGLKASYQGHPVRIGNDALMYDEGIYFVPALEMGNVVHVAIDGHYAGCMVLNDEIKRNSRNLISEARRRGISTIMLTGDHQENAEYVAYQLNVDQTFYQLLPQDKVARLEMEMAKRPGAVAFVGDGINDAPSLLKADVGIAMGGIGSDAAIDSAPVVIMNDDPLKVIDAIDIAKAVKKRASTNIVFALFIKIAVLLLATFLTLPMWIAVLADVGLSLVLIVHSLLLLRKPIGW